MAPQQLLDARLKLFYSLLVTFSGTHTADPARHSGALRVAVDSDSS